MTTEQTILNTQEAAGFLGVHVETIRRLARKGDLPSFKMGKDWRFRKDSLLDWMETSSHTAQETEKIPSSCMLVIDDEASIRKLIRINLELEGYRVITAPNGREGLELVRNNPVDLVLLDLKMPEMNGPEIISELIKTDPDLPIIIVTGYPDSQMMMDVNVQCPVMLVAKPINKKNLLRAVHTTLEGTISSKK